MSYLDFTEFIERQIPIGSSIVGSSICERFGSTWVDVRFDIPESYKTEHNLNTVHRILSLRLTTSKQDKGLPIINHSVNVEQAHE